MSRPALLDVNERIQLVQPLGESHFREYKGTFDYSADIPQTRDLKAICVDIAECLISFANADGGELFVGMEDDGTVSGIAVDDSKLQMLSQAYKTHVHEDTPLPIPVVIRTKYQGKVILYFRVEKGSDRVYLTSRGRCLQRFDKENRVVAAEQIQYSRLEKKSREYDREFIDGAGIQDLDKNALEELSKQIAGGQSPEKFLQYMDLVDFSEIKPRVRRAALLLFSSQISRWHPRCEVRIVRVDGTELRLGKEYNVTSRDDHRVSGNLFFILEAAWDTLRPYLTQVKLSESGLFRETLVYPEDACREALVNAIAHRDYGIEGKEIEIFIYDDRLEVQSPGGLLSSISIEDLTSEKRTHQSRNVYIARVLREAGYMREMGEGMLRIYQTMRDRDLVPPELKSSGTRFEIGLHHRSIFSPKDQEWLRAYESYNLSRDEQRTVLLGRDGRLLSTNDIVNTLKIVDTEEFRKHIERLRRKGILYSAIPRGKSGVKAFEKGRAKPRFAVRPPDQTDQYREDLLRAVAKAGVTETITPTYLKKVTRELSTSNPFGEKGTQSLRLLALV